MPTALRIYVNNSQRLRDIEIDYSLSAISEMNKEELINIISATEEVFSSCRSKENQKVFGRIEQRIRQRLIEIQNTETNRTSGNTNTKNNWHEKPLGKVAITATGGVLVIIAIWCLNHYFGLGL